ncbi:MAG: hypothetical protein A2Y57_01550 [Candidatus Woykebacteria bacterium RBG_13_40_7b]|uniref:Glycosyltransferase RgtA/B/C/D-like domain-containing protein n=1 Tax=Candidatus Woykebacteria bacterium RBG_13_40_7b TaxID=1802594 RepID=A0A1G1W779_9BACT|nr:MAG: hypothetical protein A2Y57_01550 [Candidatus Woykebacteria bacterium RBG_13_40_7b]
MEKVGRFFKESKIFYLIVLFLFFAFIYKFFLSQGTWHFFEYRQGSYYNFLAKSFLNLKLWVSTEPVADGLYFNGHSFFSWGPPPAVLHALLIVIKGGEVYGSTLTYVFSLINLIIFWSIIIKLSKIFFKEVRLLILIPIFIAYASGPILFNVGRGFVYEESIIIASTFLLSSILFLLFYLESQDKKNLFLLLSGGSFGLAILTRFNLAMYGPLILLYFLLGSLERFPPKNISLSFVKKFIVFTLPIILAISLQFAYNYSRFGNILEFGLKYQQVGESKDKERQSNNRFMSLQYIPYNAANYFFAPIYINKNFQLINHETKNTIGDFPKLTQVVDTGSIFLASPILLSTLLSFLYIPFLIRNKKLLIFLAATQAGLIFFLLFGIFNILSSALRYAQDFIPIFYILSFLGLMLLFKRLNFALAIFISIILFVVSTYSFVLGSYKTCERWIGYPDWGGKTKNCIKFYKPVDAFTELR